MKEIWINILNFFGLAWWVEIITQSPNCTYYFGPFATEKEAFEAHLGYIEDLEKENAIGICTTIKRCKPLNLTIDGDDEVGKILSQGGTPTLKSQLL